MSIVLDRQALAAAVRNSAEFKAFTRDLQRKTERLAARKADGRVKRRTGDYVATFETTVTAKPGSLTTLATLRLFNTKHYAIFIEEGTRAHIIRATKPHGLLVFDVGGATVFTRKPVRHPGTKAQHVIRDTLQAIADGATA